MRSFIGVDLGGTNLRAAVVTEAGDVVGRSRAGTRAGEGADAVLGRMAECAREAARAAGLSLDNISACCVGSPGPLDAAAGVVIFAPNLPGWENVPVAEEMTRRLGVTTFLENDANSAGFGEWWLGAGRGSSEMLIYTLGTGVGGCVIVRGRLHRGLDQMAGHLGHAILVPDGRPCKCGARGCVERYCSATAVADEAREAREAGGRGEDTGLGHLNPDEITAKAVFEAARAGSAYAKELLERTGRYLGIAIATAVNIIDPQVVVIAGGMVAAGEMILGPCREAVRELALKPADERVKIVPAELAGDAGIVGAAGLAMRRVDGEKADC
jgi:glucokinase